MIAQPQEKLLIRLVSAAIFLTLAGVIAVSTAFAKLVQNTNNPVAVVAGGGRHLVVTGPILCDQVERVDLRVTVTQRTTGAVAEGSTFFNCTVETQQ